MVRVRKIALLGYPAVGKSSLAVQFVESRFEEEYCTTIENHLTKTVNICGRDFELHLYDTMGVTELPNFSDEYLVMDGWIFVYSVTARRSFDVVSEIYNKLIDAGAQRQAIVLVGNKCDLSAERAVSPEEGRALAKELNAQYLETSAKNNVNVNDVFKALIVEVERQRGEPIAKQGDCCLL
eukprot:m.18512 g.18512  ORF g.18512 m.18512 type:complete len:181 (-) comp10098_c0_seq1:53-595(-)